MSADDLRKFIECIDEAIYDCDASEAKPLRRLRVQLAEWLAHQQLAESDNEKEKL